MDTTSGNFDISTGSIWHSKLNPDLILFSISKYCLARSSSYNNFAPDELTVSNFINKSTLPLEIYSLTRCLSLSSKKETFLGSLGLTSKYLWFIVLHSTEILYFSSLYSPMPKPVMLFAIVPPYLYINFVPFIIPYFGFYFKVLIIFIFFHLNTHPYLSFFLITRSYIYGFISFIYHHTWFCSRRLFNVLFHGIVNRYIRRHPSLRIVCCQCCSFYKLYILNLFARTL